MTKVSEEAIQQCLGLLKASSDEERFAGLLIVPKLFEKDDFSSLKRVYEAIGLDFILRLIKTTESDTNDSVYYHKVALNILSTFCNINELELPNNPLFHQMIPHLFRIYSDTSDLDLSLNILSSFRALLSSDSIPVLLKSSSIPSVTSHLRRTLSLPPSEDNSKKAEIDNLIEQELTLLRDLLHHLTEVDAEGQRALWETLPSLGKKFREPSLLSPLLLDCLTLLLGMINSTEDHLPRVKQGDIPSWSLDVREGLWHLLRSRLQTPQRNAALSITHMTFTLAGSSWPVYQWQSKNRSSGEPEGSFVELIVLLASVELRVALENDQLVEGQVKPSGVLRHCLGILHCALAALITDPLWENLLPETLQRFHKYFSDAQTNLREYSAECQVFRSVSSAHWQIRQRSHDVVIEWALPLMALWLAEEPDGPFGRHIHSLVGFLLTVPHSLPTLLPGIRSVTVETQVLTAFVDAKGHEKVIEYLEEALKEETLTPNIADAVDILVTMTLGSYPQVETLNLLPAIISFLQRASETFLQEKKSLFSDEMFSAMNLFVLIFSTLVHFHPREIPSKAKNSLENFAIAFAAFVSHLPTDISDESFRETWELTLSAMQRSVNNFPTLQKALGSTNVLDNLQRTLGNTSEGKQIFQSLKQTLQPQ